MTDALCIRGRGFDRQFQRIKGSACIPTRYFRQVIQGFRTNLNVAVAITPLLVSQSPAQQILNLRMRQSLKAENS
ncbi:MAG: hypothetical protein BWY63_03767 [Chloroflexi bacterium ADurb.Bin360]|nr:MAG: hypothetical protein BWY63_03767 [Chloroflexi bacterium ADurb.Bin360]